MNPSDPELDRGDDSSARISALFVATHVELCNFVDAIVRDAATAEDIVQDVFLELARKPRLLKDAASPKAYLFGAARNRAMKVLRRRGVLHKVRRLALSAGESPGAAAASPLPPEHLVACERLTSLAAAIAALPLRSRLALTLRWHHGMSYSEVAMAMGISIKGVERLLGIAMRRLRLHADDLR